MQVRWELDPSEEDARERRREERREEVDLGGLSAMMVLLLKQTHLQNDVADAVCGWWLAEKWERKLLGESA